MELQEEYSFYLCKKSPEFLHKWEFFTSPSQYGNTLKGRNFSASITQ